MMCKSQFKKLKCVFLAVLLLVSCFAGVPTGTVRAATTSDGFTTAKAVAVNKAVNGCLRNSNDSNYYKFTTASDGVVSLSFLHKELESSYNLWEITLYNADREEMLTMYSQGSVVRTNSCNMGLAAGTYYVCVDYFNGGVGVDYQLCVNYAASNDWETEFNGGYLNADEISTNAVVNGCLRNSNDEDYYKFTTASDGVVSLSFLHKELESSYNLWEITLYNADREEMLTMYSQGSVARTNSCNMGLAAGTYYVCVDYFNGGVGVDYQLCVNYAASNDWETEFNGGFTIADTIRMKQTMYGSLDSDSDRDYYKLSVLKDGYVNIKFTHPIVSKGTWSVTLYNQSREEIASFTSTNAESQTKYQAGYLIQGEYYIVVKNVSTWDSISNCDYSIQASYTAPRAYIKTVKAPGKKKLTVTWRKQRIGVSGTQVVIASNKKFTKNKKTVDVSTKKAKYTFKKLKKKKNYYVKVRNYFKVDGVKYYGPYSSVNKIKVK